MSFRLSQSLVVYLIETEGEMSSSLQLQILPTPDIPLLSPKPMPATNMNCTKIGSSLGVIKDMVGEQKKIGITPFHVIYAVS